MLYLWQVLLYLPPKIGASIVQRRSAVRNAIRNVNAQIGRLLGWQRLSDIAWSSTQRLRKFLLQYQSNDSSINIIQKLCTATAHTCQ